MANKLYINDGGTEKQPAAVHVNDSGEWKSAKVWANDAGVWRLFFDPQGDRYSYVAYGPELYKITPEGDAAWTFTAPKNISSIAVDDNGNVYIGHGDELAKLDSDGNEVWNSSAPIDHVLCVAVDESGNVYVGHEEERFTKIDSDGNEVWSVVGNNEDSVDIAVDESGNVYVGHEDSSSSTTYDAVGKYDSAGALVWENVASEVEDIALGEDGSVFFVSRGTIYKLLADGTSEGKFSAASFPDHPKIATDSAGNVYAADPNGVVWKFDSSGVEQWTNTDISSVAKGVAVDPEGNVYSCHENQQLQKLDSAGARVWVFEPTDLPSAYTPTAMAVDPGLHSAGF